MFNALFRNDMSHSGSNSPYVSPDQMNSISGVAHDATGRGQRPSNTPRQESSTHGCLDSIVCSGKNFLNSITQRFYDRDSINRRQQIFDCQNNEQLFDFISSAEPRLDRSERKMVEVSPHISGRILAVMSDFADPDERESYIKSGKASFSTFTSIWNSGNEHERDLILKKLNEHDHRIGSLFIEWATKVDLPNDVPGLSVSECVAIAGKPFAEDHVLDMLSTYFNKKNPPEKRPPELTMAILQNNNIEGRTSREVIKDTSLDQMLQLAENKKIKPYILLCIIHRLESQLESQDFKLRGADFSTISKICDAIRSHPRIGEGDLMEENLNELLVLEEQVKRYRSHVYDNVG